MQKSRPRTIGRKLVINVKRRLSEKKLRAQEIDSTISNSNIQKQLK